MPAGGAPRCFTRSQSRPRCTASLEMAAHTKVNLIPLVLACSVGFALLHSLVTASGTFVSGPQLRITVASPALQVMPAAAVALAPEMAQAATEQELNRFGFAFAVVFLLFFLAGLARLFTVGKL